MKCNPLSLAYVIPYPKPRLTLLLLRDYTHPWGMMYLLIKPNMNLGWRLRAISGEQTTYLLSYYPVPK